MKQLRNILLALILLAACPLAMPAQHTNPYAPARIAVVLPFSRSTAEGAKSLEFYRGMLLAADDLKAAGYDATITAMDEPQADKDITGIVEKLCGTNDVVAGFAYRNHMIGAGKTARVANALAAFPMATYIPHDLSSNPACVFTLTSDEQFIELYAHLLFSCFGKCNIVYVKSNHQLYTADVIDLLTQMKRKGCKSKTIEIRDAAVNIDAALSSKKTNVVITDTNNEESIAKLCGIVAAAKSRQPSVRMALCGEPSWMEITPNLQETARGIDVYIPTTWCQNDYALAIDALRQKYTQCFHTAPSLQQPSAMLQGYDFARMTIAGLARYGKDYLQHRPVTEQLLTTCRFFAQQDGRTGGKYSSCWTNIGLRLVHLKTDGRKEVIDLKAEE